MTVTRGDVRYKGGADIRQCTAAELKREGIGGDDPVTLTWSKANGFVVKESALKFLSDEDWTRLILLDPFFEVLPRDGAKAPA